MKRTVAVVCGVLIGAVLGLTVGTNAAEFIHGSYPHMDEYEYIWVALLGSFVAPVVGALVGGVVGARVQRRYQGPTL